MKEGRVEFSKAKYIVVLREYERGYGSKYFHAEGFDDFNLAKEYAKSVNAQNTAPTAPDYYINARIETDPLTFYQYKEYF